MLESFKREHSEILDVLDKIEKLGISSKEGQETLLLTKELIFTHMDKENREFYPKIKEAKKNHQMLEKALIDFDKDMNQIAHFIDLFFDINSSPERRDMQLYTEKFIEALKRRILREENILFPAFGRLQKNKFLGVKFDRRIADQRKVQSQHEEIDSSKIANKRTIERRKRNRHPIHNLFVIYKGELSFYLFILIVCIIAAVLGVYVIHSPDNVSKINKAYRDINQEKNELKNGNINRNQETGAYYLD